MILEIQKELNLFSRKHNLIEETFKSCKEAIETCFREDAELGIITLGGIPKENIRVKFNSQFLINNREYRYTPCFKTKLILFDNEGKGENFDEMEYIGYYELDVDEKGVVFDDWLVFEKN